MSASTSARGTRLRQAREGKGWSRRTLADKSGTSEATIARVELYEHQAGLDCWDAWSSILEVSLSDLLGEPVATPSGPDPEAA